MSQTLISYNHFHFRNLAGSVSTYIEKERIGKIKEREDAKKLQEYHARIMNPLFNPLLPPIPDETNPADSLVMQSGVAFASNLIHQGSRKGGLVRPESVASSGGSVLSGQQGTKSFVTQPGKPKILSMSTKLGAKAKEFGTVGIKKKKKKTKKRSKKKKR